MGGPITSGLGFSTSFHKVGKSIPVAWAARHFASNSTWVSVMTQSQRDRLTRYSCE
jgi:hypothetical protein